MCLQKTTCSISIWNLLSTSCGRAVEEKLRHSMCLEDLVEGLHFVLGTTFDIIRKNYRWVLLLDQGSYLGRNACRITESEI